MKNSALTLTACLLFTLALSATAATERWNYTAPFVQIFQIVADGTGGCGVLGIATNGHFFVAYLNKKGTPLYEKDLGAAANCLGIARVTTKNLAYWVQSVAGSVLIHVNQKGVEQTISQVNFGYYPSAMLPFYNSNFSDKKGFFSSTQDLVPPNFWYVVRLTDK
jgi:hypothetical protein